MLGYLCHWHLSYTAFQYERNGDEVGGGGVEMSVLMNEMKIYVSIKAKFDFEMLRVCRSIRFHDNAKSTFGNSWILYFHSAYCTIFLDEFIYWQMHFCLARYMHKFLSFSLSLSFFFIYCSYFRKQNTLSTFFFFNFSQFIEQTATGNPIMHRSANHPKTHHPQRPKSNATQAIKPLAIAWPIHVYWKTNYLVTVSKM